MGVFTLMAILAFIGITYTLGHKVYLSNKKHDKLIKE
jgi:hypothetical protein